ncbi:MAG: septal ring lytic transglycosylase RlpA family protein [Ferrimicrobium sp.]
MPVGIGITVVLAPLMAASYAGGYSTPTSIRLSGRPHPREALASSVVLPSTLAPNLSVTLFGHDGLAVVAGLQQLAQAGEPTGSLTVPAHDVPPPPPVPPPSRDYSQSGTVSWYGSPAGTCASPGLPFGTVVTVTNVASGATVRCVVNDRGPYVWGRILDLSPASFSNIAPLGQGLVYAVISWD